MNEEISKKVLPLAPICLFVYNRLDTLQKNIASLENNFLAQDSDLYIFADGAKNNSDLQSVLKVRTYIKTITGFKSIIITESDSNKGLDPSVISGVSVVLQTYETVIVLEDDLILATNFLSFMNQALNFYKLQDKVFSISGNGLDVKKPASYQYDVYMYQRPSSWGWAIWKDRWETVDWEIKDWESFKNDRKQIKEFNKTGSDMFSMLKHSLQGGNMWDIRFSYNIFKQNKLCVTPVTSKTINDGFTVEGTHCNVYNRFDVVFDESNKTDFIFVDEVKEIKSFSSQVYAYYSFFARVKGKILTKYYTRQKISMAFLLLNINMFTAPHFYQVYYTKIIRFLKFALLKTWY